MLLPAVSDDAPFLITARSACGVMVVVTDDVLSDEFVSKLDVATLTTFVMLVVSPARSTIVYVDDCPGRSRPNVQEVVSHDVATTPLVYVSETTVVFGGTTSVKTTSLAGCWLVFVTVIVYGMSAPAL